MPQHICMSGMMMCTMGVAPSSLMVLPAKMCMTSNMPAATIMDNVPMMNIMPFGMCMSPANPMVAAATAAAMGVLTPMPCIPNTPAPWLVGAPTAMLGNLPVLNNTSTLMCIWAGTISVTFPGEVTEQTP